MLTLLFFYKAPSNLVYASITLQFALAYSELLIGTPHMESNHLLQFTDRRGNPLLPAGFGRNTKSVPGLRVIILSVTESRFTSADAIRM